MSIEQDILNLQAKVAYLETLPGGAVTGTWTPTVTQSGAVTCTVTRATYARLGKLCFVQARLDVTGAGTITNPVVIGGQPSIIQPAAGTMLGVGHILNLGTAFYGGLSVIALSATAWRFTGFNTGDHVGVVPDFALAASDEIHFALAYMVP